MATDHFSGVSKAYAEFRPRYPQALFEWISSLVPRHERAWDCACGSGQATIDLAAHFDRVVATDMSRAQIESASTHSPISGRISWRVATAEASGLDAASVDLVTVAQALHWLDVERFYDEVRRVLRPGGALAVWTYGIAHLDDPEADAVFGRFLNETLAAWWPPERRHIDSGYRTLPFPFDEIAAPAFEIRDAWTIERLVGYTRSWSASARHRAATGIDPVDAFERELLAVWSQADQPCGITWPLSVRAGRP